MHNYFTEAPENLIHRNAWFILAGGSSMFLWGIILFMSVTVYDFEKIPKNIDYIYPVSAATGLLSGNLVFGHISDRIGRRRPFLFSIFLTAAGIMGAVLSSNFVQLTVSIFMANFSLGGDETVLLSYIFEEYTRTKRSRYIIGITNMANAGVFFTAFFLYAIPLSLGSTRIFLLLSSFSIIAIAIVSRLKIAESPGWEASHSLTPSRDMMKRKVREVWGYSGKHFSLVSDFEQITTGTAIVTGFFLINIYLGELYTDQPYLVTLLTTGAGVLSGIILTLLVTRIPHKTIPVISFPAMAALVIIAVVLSFYSMLPFSILLWILVFRSFLSEIGWGSRDLLQSELTLTTERARHISRIRAFSYSVLILLYFIIYQLEPPLLFYLIIISIVEIMGAAGALVWYFRGVESGRKDII